MSSPAPSAEPPQAPPYNAAPLLIAFTLILLVCFFLGFCIVYMCRCCLIHLLQVPNSGGTASISLVRPPAVASPSHGLDPLLLQTFPSFPYSSVKEYRKEKYGLECAICLLEFEAESLLRLLTICCHVFHQECIDLWLMTHKTCPVCRRELDSTTSLQGKGLEFGDISDRRSSSIADNDVHIDVKDEEDDNNDQNERREEASGKNGESNVGKFSRSHSTGHSIVLIRGEGREGDSEEGDDDKYTLRLPEDVKVKLFRGHHYAHSCSTYKEMTKHEPCGNCGFVDGSGVSFGKGKKKI